MQGPIPSMVGHAMQGGGEGEVPPPRISEVDIPLNGRCALPPHHREPPVFRHGRVEWNRER
jgi:hypothetical protein